MISLEHQQYSINSGLDEKNWFTFDRAKSGLWSPARAALYTRVKFDDRVVLLVAFKTTDTEGCVDCMMLRTEVFYLHPSKKVVLDIYG